MQNENITIRPIGILHSPFKQIDDMPIQPAGAIGIRGSLEIAPEYEKGLADLDGFSHIILIYYFHQVTGYQLSVTPFLDSVPRGIFSTRAPTRPNPIGISIVQLISVQDNILELENIDILDRTPVIDIKPYIPAFDQPEEVQVGWLTNHTKNLKNTKSDQRFK